MNILYFAWVRDRVGIAREDVAPHVEVATVGDLIDWLAARGGGHAEAFADLSVIRAAVNQKHVPLDHPVTWGDEIAFFPPVTGGAPAPVVTIQVQEADFNTSTVLDGLGGGNTRIGGVATFVGLVRDFVGEQKISALELEHYPGMTERELARLVDAALERWTLESVTLIHRYGRLLPGDRIVLVAVASAHRQAALDACGFLIDWLKVRAPFWKHEVGPDGGRWINARDSDNVAAARWNGGR